MLLGTFSGCSCFFTFYYAKGGDVAQILYAMKYHARKKLCCKMGEYMAGELCDSGFLKE